MGFGLGPCWWLGAGCGAGLVLPIDTWAETVLSLLEAWGGGLAAAFIWTDTR